MEMPINKNSTLINKRHCLLKLEIFMQLLTDQVNFGLAVEASIIILIFFYLFRPEIIIKRVNPERKIGAINEPSDCYNFLLNISDQTGKDKYCVNARCTQCGVGWRSSVFGKCYEVFFPIFEAGDLSKEVGLIHKKHTACENPENEEEIKDAEAVEVNFPKDATKEEKFLLMCTALTVDYRFYEENPNEVESEAKME
jgi:hypothetical protein